MSTLPPSRPTARSILLGGLLPVVAFALLEEWLGIVWGVIAGMAFGISEILWEKFRHGKVEVITWAGNGLLLLFGGVALFTQDGIWFKLQPALLQAGMGVGLAVSVFFGRPFLVLIAERQGTFDSLPPERRSHLLAAFGGLTLRMAIFLGAQAAFSVWVAFHWTTRAWAVWKGVGLPATLFIYMGLEMLILRRYLLTSGRSASRSKQVPPKS